MSSGNPAVLQAPKFAQASTVAEGMLPEVLLTAGISFLVSISNAWRSHWKSPYCYKVETLLWLLEANSDALRCQAEMASLMQAVVSADKKWTQRKIKRLADKRYVNLWKAEDLPERARLCGAGNDLRAKYPFPTDLFHRQFLAWSQLRARVFIQTAENIKAYNQGELPNVANLPPGIVWDYVAWQANSLKPGRF